MQLVKNRNVFLFGAGVSHGAGIPLLGAFMDRLLEIAMRKKSKHGVLNDQDSEVFDAAVKVRETLDEYHGRAAFDDRNIEDILSILALGANSGRKYEQQKFNSFVRAIARTIDLECEIKPSALAVMAQSSASTVYGKFWKSIINNAVYGGSAPTIITLNYDLVLERTLISTISGCQWNPIDRRFPFERVRICYHSDTVADQTFRIEQARYYGDRDELKSYGGYKLTPEPSTPLADDPRTLSIPILKPHGSLNFPKTRSNAPFDLQAPQESPLLMPPIFNKAGNKALYPVWAEALDALRRAVNVVICGYSLPRTDMYMQFFLKAALGPNKDLSRIFVYDPLLFRKDATADSMRSRYSDVFSEQIRSRIDFAPSLGAGQDGTFQRMVDATAVAPERLLFLQ